MPSSPENTSPLHGDTYSRLYIVPDAPLRDSERARNRLGARARRLFESCNPGERLKIAQFIHEESGARLPDDGQYGFSWDRFFRTCAIRDVLCAVTHIGRYLQASGSPTKSANWLFDARRIFAQEHLAYVIDVAGVVHPLVDQEFERNRVSAIAGLQMPRYANVLDAFQKVPECLLEIPPDAKGAWRAVFSANEGLFKLIFRASPRLTAGEIDARLAPVVRTKYGGEATALRVAQRQLQSFKEWVEASHNYRHEPRSEGPAQPPLELAILAISEGTSFLRWLCTLDTGAR
jgi:hypothetical protein